MGSYKRILICLDNTEFDQQILEYTSQYCQLLKAEQVYFLTVCKSLDLPEDVTSKYPDLLAPVDESIKNDLDLSISKYFKVEVPYMIDVLDGNPTESILKWARVKNIDLLFMGHKNNFSGGSALVTQISKLVHCSMALISPNPPTQIRNIIVPVDFSDHARMALEHAVGMAYQHPDIKVTCLHFFEVPTGYSKTGKSLDEFREIMRNNSDSEFKKFTQNISFEGTQFEFLNEYTERSAEVPTKIHQLAEQFDDSLIIMGARGRSRIASIILGSITYRLIPLLSRVPLVVIKDKDQNIGFFEAILQI
jgi:nucleotide-binding universal stress UspA family protein